MEIADSVVSAVELKVNQADEELGCNSLGLKGLLLRGKKWASEAVATTTSGSVVGTSRTDDGASTASTLPVFNAPMLFRSDDYFVAGGVSSDSKR